MYRYVKAGPATNLLKGLMNRMKSFLSDAVADAFEGNPKQTKVKDPDTGAIGTLYEYEGKKNGSSLNVECYPFPGVASSFIVKCYLTKKGKVNTDSIMILNKFKGKAVQPITIKQLKKELAAYCEMFKDELGVRKMKEAQNQFSDEMKQMQEEDGFEAEQEFDEE